MGALVWIENKMGIQFESALNTREGLRRLTSRICFYPAGSQVVAIRSARMDKAILALPVTGAKSKRPLREQEAA